MVNISKQSWGEISGQEVSLYTISNADTIIKVSNFGALIQSVMVHDQNNKPTDIILGYDTLEEYIQDDMSIGTVPAVFVNRISDAQFKIDDKTYDVGVSKGKYCLHAGPIEKEIWFSTEISNRNGCGVTFSLSVGDNYHGFPGPINFKVSYFMTNAGQLQMYYYATSGQTTAINLTNHAYYNLDGDGDILKHHLKLNSTKITDTNENLVASGDITDISDSVFDFSKTKVIGKDIKSDDENIQHAGGYDFNYVLDTTTTKQIRSSIDDSKFDVHRAAKLYSDKTGIQMTVSTSQPGVQVYTSNSLTPRVGKNNSKYGKYSAVCLETQHFPNSPNIPSFPSTLLKKREKYSHVSVFDFWVVR